MRGCVWGGGVIINGILGTYQADEERNVSTKCEEHQPRTAQLHMNM